MSQYQVMYSTRRQHIGTVEADSVEEAEEKVIYGEVINSRELVIQDRRESISVDEIVKTEPETVPGYFLVTFKSRIDIPTNIDYADFLERLGERFFDDEDFRNQIETDVIASVLYDEHNNELEAFTN